MTDGIDTSNLIECDGLTKRYGDNYVFKSASFTIRTGVTGIIAPNGYGKTTFIEMCAGARKNYTGRLSIFGKMPDQIKQLIGFVADKPAFPKNIKAGEYVRIVSELYGTHPDQDLIRLARIDSVSDVRIGDLSAGYLKRLAFLLAVVHSPKVVLADEPFSNVDKMAVGVMQEMINELRKYGVSFVISSHDLNELVRVADRILIIGEHRLKEVTPGNISQRVLEVSSEDDELLYELLRKDYGVERTGKGLRVVYTDLKNLLGVLTTFEKEIITLKIADERERFLDEIYEAISRD
ncbi:MAG: ATP-binding cassette domain-containing protein [Thermoplasmataceae archaeon]